MIYELVIENIYNGERQEFNVSANENQTNFEVFCKAMNNLVAFTFNLAELKLISFKKSKINKNALKLEKWLKKLLEGEVVIFDFISLSNFIDQFPKELHTLSIQHSADGLYYAIADEMSIKRYKFYKESKESE